MPKQRTKRALLLTGAGASIPFGAPSTSDLTSSLENNVLADDWMRHCGSDRAWSEIFTGLANYLNGGAGAVNFEHVYHCAHELLSTFDPTPGTVNEFRPVLVPFITRRSDFTVPARARQRSSTTIFPRPANARRAAWLRSPRSSRGFGTPHHTVTTSFIYDDLSDENW